MTDIMIRVKNVLKKASDLGFANNFWIYTGNLGLSADFQYYWAVLSGGGKENSRGTMSHKQFTKVQIQYCSIQLLDYS
jgi:hypothetical protein